MFATILLTAPVRCYLFIDHAPEAYRIVYVVLLSGSAAGFYATNDEKLSGLMLILALGYLFCFFKLPEFSRRILLPVRDLLFFFIIIIINTRTRFCLEIKIFLFLSIFCAFSLVYCVLLNLC